MYRYETHLHTVPVSKCARANVRDTMEFYKSIGYDGIFITNHFIDGNINVDRSLPYEDRINFYFSDYEEAKRLESEIGIRIFLGVEVSYAGTDFLVYGLDKEWFLSHPDLEKLTKKQQLALYMENGALVIHAHPFRESGHIDHIRLFPRSVQGIEIINANRTDFENEMAKQYADNYGFFYFAGSDNHVGGAQKKFAGMESETPIIDEYDFIERVRESKMQIFAWKREE